MEPKQVARYLFNLQSREVLSSRQLDLHYFKHRSIVFISLLYSLVGTPKITWLQTFSLPYDVFMLCSP